MGKVDSVAVDRPRLSIGQPLARMPAWVEAVALGAVAAMLSVFRNIAPSVWIDESATMSALNRSFAGLVQMAQHVDLVHVAYYATMYVWVAALGDSASTLRTFSGIAVGIAVGTVVAIGRMLWSRVFGVIAGIVFLVLPVTSWMALQARSEALSTMLTVVGVALAIAAIRSRGRRSTLLWIGYAVVGLLSIAVFVFTILAFVSIGVAVFTSRAPRRVRMAWTGYTAALTLFAGGFLLVLRTQSDQVSWIPPLSGATLESVAVVQFFRGFFRAEVLFAAVVGLLLLVGIVQAARSLRQGRSRPIDESGTETGTITIGPVRLALGWLLIPLAAMLVASLVVAPVYTPAYLAFTAPAFALLIAAALLVSLNRVLTAVSLIVILTFGAIAYWDQRMPWASFGSSWQAAATTLADAARPGDGVLFTVNGNESSRGLKLAYPEAFVALVDPGPRISPEADGSLWGVEPDATAIRSTDGRLWVIELQPGTTLPSLLGYHVSANRVVGWVGLTLLESDG